MSYNKFFRFFQKKLPEINKLGDPSLGEQVLMYSPNIPYSNFRNQYTILNLDKLENKKELVKMQAYLDFNNTTINFVNVKKLNLKLLPVYRTIFSKSSNNKLFEK
jgi:hypothetical protein